MGKRGQLYAYSVKLDELVEACDEMNFEGKFFRSRVEEVVATNFRRCVLLVRHFGRFPFLTDGWKKKWG